MNRAATVGDPLVACAESAISRFSFGHQVRCGVIDDVTHLSLPIGHNGRHWPPWHPAANDAVIVAAGVALRPRSGRGGFSAFWTVGALLCRLDIGPAQNALSLGLV
jgi:hypothetical protein